jgi:hypothetical protein
MGVLEETVVGRPSVFKRRMKVAVHRDFYKAFFRGHYTRLGLTTEQSEHTVHAHLRFTTFSYRFQNIFERQTEYRNSHLTDSP